MSKTQITITYKNKVCEFDNVPSSIANSIKTILLKMCENLDDDIMSFEFYKEEDTNVNS